VAGHFELMHMSHDHLIQLQSVLTALLHWPSFLLTSIGHKTGGKAIVRWLTPAAVPSNIIRSSRTNHHCPLNKSYPSPSTSKPYHFSNNQQPSYHHHFPVNRQPGTIIPSSITFSSTSNHHHHFPFDRQPATIISPQLQLQSTVLREILNITTAI